MCVVSTASATEPLNDNLTATDTGGVIGSDVSEKLSISDIEEELSAEGDTITVDCNGGGDYTTISDAVSAANGGETIFIKNGEYTEAPISGISKQLTFTGESQNGVIIKTTGTTGFLTTTESGYTSLIFNNLTFKDVNGGSGATINIGGNGNVNILNCTFDSCYSRYGSIRIFTSGALLIEDCKILNSQSSTGSYSSAIDLGGSGTNDYTIKNTVIDNSSIKSTSAATYIFGMIYNEATSRTLTLDNVTLSNCICDKSNGLISTKGNMKIKNSKLINNIISRDGIFGLIFISGGKSVTIETTQITNNTESNYLLTSNSASASFDLSYNNIQDNTFKTAWVNPNYDAYVLDANYWGSNSLPDGITASTWIVEENGVYKLNTGEEIDVIIPGLNDETEPEPEIEYDIYVDCYAADGGDGSKENPFNSILNAITAADDGKTIFVKNGEYIEDSLSFTKSVNIIGESKDGVIVKANGNIAMLTTTSTGIVLSFNNLTFKDSARTGGSGLMFFGGTVDWNFDNCNFINLSSKYGAIQMNTAGTITISNCLFDNVKEKSNSPGAGLMYLNGGGITNIIDTIITNCGYEAASGQMNGLIYVYGSSNVLNIERTVIKNNKGPGNGLIRTAGEVNIRNSSIVNNTIELNPSGGVGDSLFYVTKTLNIEQSIIANNSGPKNLVYSGAAGSTTMNYNYIQNNTFPSGFKTANGALDAEYNYWGSNDKPTDPSVTRYAIMDGEGHFTDDEGNALAKEIPVPGDDGDEPQPAVLDIIYVSDSTGSDDNDGSISAPVKTIAKAIELAQNGKVVILVGNYTLTETLSIDKDLDIEGRGTVLIKSNFQIISTSKALNLTNIKFDSTADISGAVITTTNDLNIDSCVFYANTESGSAIHADGGNIVIANSVLLNPIGYALTATSSSTVNANNNWWGKNQSANTEVAVSSWIVMDASVDLAKINPGDEVTITVSFNKTNAGSDYAGTLPEFDVKITASSLDTNATVKNNKASVKYTVNADDEATVTSGSEQIVVPLKLYDPPEVIYVDALNGADTNDGDEAHPVQSIAKAIELAIKGKIIILEGTYTIDSTLIVNNDLDIKGQGNVIIDGNSKRILNNNANLNISNVQFTNGFDSSAVIVNNANLTLNNTLFYSNVNLNGYGASVVRNNKKLIVDNSKFYENKERYGNIYNNNGAELLINNSEFYDNDVTDVTTVATGIALYSEGGNAVIENSKFYNNKGNFSVIYFLSRDSLSSTVVNNLTITNCIFDNNELVRYGAVYSQKANTTIKDSTFTNNVVKKSSIANGEGAAIYVTGEKVTVETSVFKNNNAADSGKDIYVYAGELDISDSVLINENGYSIEKASAAVVNANDNWWGNNTPNTDIDVERWVVMTVSSNDDDIQIGDEITITASFDKTNDGADYTGDLPEVFDVTFTSTSGNLNEVKAVENKKAEVTYTVDYADKKITVTSDNAIETLTVNRILDIIYVSTEGSDDNDGDRDAPVATLAKAISLLKKAKSSSLQVLIRQVI